MSTPTRLPGGHSLALLLLLLPAGGCAANPIRAWQRSLEAYVAREGNGDLNVLRSPDRDPAEIDFGLIGARNEGIPFIASRRTDASGVLLGRRVILGRGWYFFLVGAVQYRGRLDDWPLDDPEVTDIRLIATSSQRGRFTWHLSEPAPKAMARYAQPQLQAWRASHPDRAGADTAPTTFPTPADVFRLDAGPEAFIAVDEHSGAAWTLPAWEAGGD